MGALTSKTYSFANRSWEFASYITYDFLFSLGFEIRLDVYNNSLVRVLPVGASFVPWISDYTRYSYDGLFNQRVRGSFIRVDSSFFKVSLEDAFWYMSSFLKKHNFGGISYSFIFGKNIDLESGVSGRDFIHFLGSSNLFCYSGSKLDFDVDCDLRSSFCLGNHIFGFDSSDFLLLCGVNLRLESPLLNLVIRKRSNVLVYSLGSSFLSSGFVSCDLGNSFRVVFSIYEGSNICCSKLLLAKKPIIALGSSFLNVFGHGFCREFMRNISLHVPSLIPEDVGSWFGFKFIFPLFNQVGLLDLGVSPGIHSNFNWGLCYSKQFCILGGLDDFSFFTKSEDSFIIYLGGFFDLGSRYADVILGSSLFFEKKCSALSSEGDLCLFDSIFSQQDFEDWVIVNAFWVFLVSNFPSFFLLSYSELNKKIYRISYLETLRGLHVRLSEISPLFRVQSNSFIRFVIEPFVLSHLVFLFKVMRIVPFNRKFFFNINMIVSSFVFDISKINPVSRFSNNFSGVFYRFNKGNFPEFMGETQ